MTMRIREQVDGDMPAVLDVVGRAFGRPVVVDLVVALQDGPARAGGVSLVAEDDDGIVGHVQLSRSWVDAPDRLLNVLVLSPLAVHPDRQGAGTGSALVRAALDWAADAGWPLVFLEGSPVFYGRLGFEPATARGFTAPSVRIPPPGFQVAVLPAAADWMTGALVYADAFWALDCVGLR